MSHPSLQILRGGLLFGMIVLVVVGCSGGKSVTLPENPPTVLRPVDYDSVYAVSEVDKRPKARGGMRAIQQRIDYPDALKRLGIGGRVHVQFVVSPKGQSNNIEVVKRAHPDLEREARRVIMASPFEPGTLNDDPVPVRMTLPLTFRSRVSRIEVQK
mgnify:CR=1 FL=1